MEILQMCGLPGLRDISRYERKLEFQTKRETSRTLLLIRVATGGKSKLRRTFGGYGRESSPAGSSMKVLSPRTHNSKKTDRTVRCQVQFNTREYVIRPGSETAEDSLR